MSVYKAVSEYKSDLRFHMPGHSGEDIQLTSREDITELSFSDNLLNADGCILRTEQTIAKAYGAKYALIFTAGATSALQSAIAVAKQLGYLGIRADSRAHKSVYSAAHIQGLRVDDNAKAAVHTSPDYFGNVYPIPQGEFIITDASHAAHYPFCSMLPAFDLSADITVTSLHKTLPVLTGGAIVLCNNANIYERLLLARSMTHSTSPSYLIMASIDKAVRIMSEQGEELYKRVYDAVQAFKRNIKYKTENNADFSRVVININPYDAYAFSEILEKSGLYIEMSYENKLVLIVTPYNADKLSRAAEIINGVECPELYSPLPSFDRIKGTESDKIELVGIENAAARTCALEVGIYPPGTALIRRGEIFTTEIIEYVKAHKENCFGLIHDKLTCYGR